MLEYHLARYKNNFEIDFLFIAYLSNPRNIKKDSQTTMSLDLLRCSRGTLVKTPLRFNRCKKQYENLPPKPQDIVLGDHNCCKI